MDTNVLSAVREGTDLSLTLPCGVLVSIPGPVLQDWAKTPASPELLAAASAAMGTVGEVKFRGSLEGGETSIIDVIMPLLPTLLPICIPLITNSITKPQGGDFNPGVPV